MNNPVEYGPRYDSTRQAWESIWDSADVERELELLQSKRAQQALKLWQQYLPKDGILLEAGCGLSATMILLRRLGYPLIGLDYAENALHTSRHYDPSLPLAVGDVHALPYAENSLSAYLSFGVLEHFEHGMMPALKESFRVLRPGGILLLTIPYPNVVYRLVEWRRKRQGQAPLTDDSFYESAYTRQQLVENVTGVGFEVLTAQPTSHAYTLWGLGGVFRGPGYYQTSLLADALGSLLAVTLPWAFNFSTMVIGRKPPR